MAVYDVKRIGRGDGGGQDAESQERTASWLVRCDSPFDDLDTVLDALPVRVGESYPFGAGLIPLRCERRDADRIEENAPDWVAVAEFRTPPDDEEEDRDPEEPLNDPPEISVDYEDREVPVTRQADGEERDEGDPIANSMGIPFDPPPTKRSAGIVITITRNESVSNAAVTTAYRYKNAVNSDAFWGFEPGQCQMVSISLRRAFRTTPSGLRVRYLVVTYKISANPDGHQLSLLDVGPTYTSQEEGEVEFKTRTGQPTIGLLDGYGYRSETPHYLDFDIYPELPFAPLRLPQRL